MSQTPKISIIIPVYKVEQYLRQCLNSVVNQTMREIQIICVNDGSPDNSRTILQEYADRDSRIDIIDKTNGGLSSARNAAYPLIKGKYVLFVDSDDWIDLALCEKTYQKAEETGAQMTLFSYQEEGGHGSAGMFRTITPNDKTTVEEKLPVLDYPIACGKLWRSDFLLDNKLYFPEGLVFEDNLFNWKAVVLADRISVVPLRLYHYRCVSSSISQTGGEHVMHIFPIFEKIHEYLLEAGCYTAYRDKFISKKLNAWHYHYHHIQKSLKPRYVAKIRESLTAEDWEFIHTAPKNLVPRCSKLFYEKMIDGRPSLLTTVDYYFSLAIYGITKRPPRQIFQWVIKQIRARLNV